MAKKRKTTGRAAPAEELGGFNEKGGRMRPIQNYEDIADSEDEFHMNRDKILLDEGPDAKRRKKWQEEDAGLEPSDEEVLGYSSESEEEDDNEDVSAPRKSKSAALSDDEASAEEDEEDVEGWGTSKKDYYNNDQPQTETDALEEEAEAKRLQQKKLQKMSEADFGFDEDEWLETRNEEDDGDVVTEVLKDIEITPEMTPEERLRILQTRYPEFEFLANEYLQLQPLLQDFQQRAGQQSQKASTSAPPSTTVIQCRALAAYMASLTMYFAILTSPAMDGEGEAQAMDPSELRDHAVMDSLLQCRELWTKVKSLREPSPMDDISDNESLPAPSVQKVRKIPKLNGAVAKKSKSKKAIAKEAAAAEAAALRAERIKAAEEDFQDLSSLLPRSRKTKNAPKTTEITDDNSDFGEEESMDAKAAAEKASKKKSLRFYTSQIVQKSNKRADAGRDAGGDTDLPVRERLRDRQARLNAEAEARGKKLDEYGRGGAALGEGSDSDDGDVAQEVRDGEDEYYDMVAKTQKKKKADKNLQIEAIKQAEAEGKIVRIVEGELDEDGKRAIGYVIEKNKGLAPKRKKDVRNPRVKKRKKYEEKKKKLSSMRAVYKGGEERGGYGGEKTGIKAGLVKSIKL